MGVVAVVQVNHWLDSEAGIIGGVIWENCPGVGVSCYQLRFIEGEDGCCDRIRTNGIHIGREGDTLSVETQGVKISPAGVSGSIARDSIAIPTVQWIG
jgi:hypothetical protein